MNILSVENLTKSLGQRVLFSNLTFGISKGEKVALVAKNGAGKTTLLNMISGKDSGDSGVISMRKEMRVAFVQQEPHIPENVTLFDAVFAAENPLLNAISLYEHALLHPEDDKQLQKAMDAMDTHNAWDYEVRIRQILSELNLHNLEQNTNTLSGGQRKRLALALALIQEPDFLILDEPTNHLDLNMIEWLEEYFKQNELTLLMVTHDRYFLDRVCTVIIELDNRQLYRYEGNYSYYTEKKAERQAAEMASVEKAKNLYRRELEWMRRQPKARGTKSKSRIDAFYDLEARAKQRLQEKQVKLEIRMKRIGGKILELHHLNKSFGEKRLINDFSYIFKQGDRIGIIGNNGTGKSTFLKMITGVEPVDGGNVVTGDTIVFGYYTQDGIQLPEDKRVIEVVKDIAEFLPMGKNKTITASQLLERFLFAGDQQYAMVSKLSGGERRRLYLCTILLKNPNFLILDEPTNDLDIMTLNVLEDFLEEYPGCLLIVSHDRYFMDKLTDHLFVFEGEGVIRDFNGNYSDYREELDEKEILAAAEKKGVKTAPKPVEAVAEKTPVKKASFKEMKEFEQLEQEIARIESRKSEINAIFENPPADTAKLKELSDEMQSLNQQQEEKELRWLELSERVGA
ncbi:MAG: ABC-F family ATP-binding cassette domain-containing protein [Mucilaginibacter polytrichastri]|nr:ABC-F family ATP-binding cassette domain-containing protein [Mucilaginibacter polytrichastri]